MICGVCGGENFEKHAGFMYCAVCQTQSQEYYEQEYDYHDHTVNVIRQRKSHIVKPAKPKFYDDGQWSSWEAFNYILYGMTKEMKKCGVAENFEKLVFKLWAAYLKECEAAFISKNPENMPKLGFNFKERDARILYNFDLSTNSIGKKRNRSKSCDSIKTNTSDSSASLQSKRSLALQKGRIMEADYQDHLSLSLENITSLADETLESLGRSSELETSDQNSDESETLTKKFKLMFTDRNYKLFNKSYKSKKLMKRAKEMTKKDVQSPGKNKLLSIIHLALLMTGSEIQLSDLLRFIRESHLSYSKVTHFFPRYMKFPKRDLSYVEVISDALMPTHLHQRKITSQLAYLLKVGKILTPNMNKLIDRYCNDLNLPKQIAELSKKISGRWVPPTIVPRSKTALPSYEAWAMASIIFVIKLLFGLNNNTEKFLSHLAREVNSASKNNNEDRLFVFEDWQEFIECRKTVLVHFHYPTREQLGGNFLENSKNFLAMLMKESKDEYRKERFIPYSKYYINEELLRGVKETLSALSKSQNIASFEFQPSLIPHISHTETIIRCVTQETDEITEKTTCHKFSKVLPEEILKRSFKNCDLEFVYNPKFYFKLVGKNSDLRSKFDFGKEFPGHDSEWGPELLFNCSSRYWVFDYPDSSCRKLVNFKQNILKETPENFQWLITECARMLEMNVRDVYDELLRLEKKYKPTAEGL